jgi:predicted MPP superfamily phosphohydrolase
LSPLDRRSFLKAGAAMFAGSLLAIEGRTIVIDTDDPKLVSIEIPLARLPSVWDGLTIAQLSDFHYDGRSSLVPIRKAIEMVNRLRPDLIVLTGDFVTLPFLFKLLHNSRQAARFAEPCAVLLSQLRAPLGVFAVLGNHDVLTDPDFIVASLQANGMEVLRNRSVPLERQGKRLWLAGLDDALNGDADLEITMREVPGQEPVVLLVHEPDYVRRVARYAVDLQLSGHSHGGQIVIPLIGPPYLPPLGERYPKGLYRIGPLTLYTNAGLGTIRIPARWNCPAEVTLVRLRTAEGKAASAQQGS